MNMRPEGATYVLGGNETTLAIVSTLRPVKGVIEASLLPLAWTPVGVVIGESRQRVGIAADGLGAWVDRTFPASDEHAFVSSAVGLEMLQRVGWESAMPETLSDRDVINFEDVPPEVLDALSQTPLPLVQCANCRRLCVRDQFVWNERELCAWDFHAAVFGRRGPWRMQPYDEHLFASLPKAAYVSALLLDELNVDAVLAAGGLSEATLRAVVNTALEGDASYMAVRTEEGISLLRERRS